MRQHALVDPTTAMQVTDVSTDATDEIPSPLTDNLAVNLLFKQFPGLTQSTAKHQSPTHNTVHFTETSGPPV